MLELNVARLEGWLEGETPEARYAHYVETLQRDPSAWVRLLEDLLNSRERRRGLANVRALNPA